jgi:hypothetical protein
MLLQDAYFPSELRGQSLIQQAIFEYVFAAAETKK